MNTERSKEHPDENKVLLRLDGELSSSEARMIDLHLQQCQECRSSTQRLRDGIDAFVSYKQTYLLPVVGSPPNRWDRFPALLDRISRDSQRV